MYDGPHHHCIRIRIIDQSMRINENSFEFDRFKHEKSLMYF